MTMKSRINLGFAVATMEAGLLRNEKFVHQISNLKCPAVVVNQYREKAVDSEMFGSHVRVLNVRERGLSLSRNLAMDALVAMDVDFVVVCDDDIHLIPEGIEEVHDLIRQDGGQAALYFTRLQKTTGEPWRARYEEETFSLRGLSFESKRRLQTINSMEQIYSLAFLHNKGLQFNTDFGAGSGRYQMGEETLMSWSILAEGGTLTYLPVACRVHPPLCSGSTYSNALMRSIFAVHRKMFGVFGMITFSVFFVKTVLRALGRILRPKDQIDRQTG